MGVQSIAPRGRGSPQRTTLLRIVLVPACQEAAAVGVFGLLPRLVLLRLFEALDRLP